MTFTRCPSRPTGPRERRHGRSREGVDDDIALDDPTRRWAPAGGLGGQSKTSAHATATKALAAINGDFGGTASPRRPEHPSVQNGVLWTSGSAPANDVG
ncbi:MAG: hypothetical protein ACHQY1_05575 [Myxococcota bacterium]